MKALLRVKLLVLAIILGATFSVVAQNRQKPKYMREDDKRLKKLAYYASDNGFIVFRDDTTAVVATTFFENYKESLGIGANYQFRALKDETDEKGQRHQRFQLYFKNLLVEGSEFTLHSQKDRLVSANGRIAEELDFDVEKKGLTEAKALEIALQDQKVNQSDLEKIGLLLPRGQIYTLVN